MHRRYSDRTVMGKRTHCIVLIWFCVLLNCSSYANAQTSTCGFNATATAVNQPLTDENWPGYLDDEFDCEWNLEARPGFRIKLTIYEFYTEKCECVFGEHGSGEHGSGEYGNYSGDSTDYSVIEEENDFKYCALDENEPCGYLEIFDGSTKIHRLTFKKEFLHYAPIVSSGLSLTLRFITEGEGESKVKFNATFTETISSTKAVDPKLHACGFNATATDDEQILQSPGWPYFYKNLIECKWFLAAPPGSKVIFTMLHRDLYYSDELTIQEDSENEVKIKNICHPGYKGDVLTIVFTSEYEINNRQGFRGTFKRIDKVAKNIESQETHFQCDDGSNINFQKFCDGNNDCDGSDEMSIPTGTKKRCMLSSRNRACYVDRRYICNISDTCRPVDYCDAGCSSHYRCKNQSCVERSTLCDGDPTNGCQEDDEWEDGIGFQCVRQGKLCRIPQQLLWDGIKDCDNGDDLCYAASGEEETGDLRSISSASFNRSRCFQCLDLSMIVPRHKVCDGVIDCSDLSDECLCNGDIPSVCNNIRMRNEKSNSSCDIGQVDCGICIHRTSVCDSVGDCPDNLDEKQSFCGVTLNCSEGKLGDAGSKCRCREKKITGVVCDGVGDCPPETYFKWTDQPGFPEDECESICSNSFLFGCTKKSIIGSHERIPFIKCVENSECTVRRCDGIVDCKSNEKDEFNCTNRFTCKAGKFVNIDKSKRCDGIYDCDDKSDEDSAICPHRFYCPALGGKQVSIDKQFVCDAHINCDDSSDETTNCSDGRFYCESKEPLFVSEKKKFDGRRDCSDWSDECPIKTPKKAESIFSSRYHLIANVFLRVLVWIMALAAVVGNGVVIFGQFKTLKVLKGRKETPQRVKGLLILNLAVADFLMGIYLLMLGGAGSVYEGVFCNYKLEWLTSATCVAMGVLVVLSSETSVFTMVLLTASRLYAVMKPRNVSIFPKVPHLIGLIMLSWILSFLLAIAPTFTSLQYQFAEKAMIENNPFFQNVTVSFDSAKEWARKMITFDSSSSEPNAALQQIRDARSWPDLKAVVDENMSGQFEFEPRVLGYYSAESVCIPRLYVTTADKSWRFSIAITTINFLSFMFVAFTYAYIVTRSRKTALNANASKASKKAAAKRISEMQRRITRLIATDFCCWIPITILAYMSIGGVVIPNSVYAFSAIILLPINSALNPLLYSTFVDKLALTVKSATQSTSANLLSRSAKEPDAANQSRNQATTQEL